MFKYLSKYRHLINLYDILLIIFFIFIAIIIYYFQNFPLSNNPDKIEIYVNNKVVRVIPFSEVLYLQEKSIIHIEGELGKMIFQLDNNGVKVIETHCPNKLCQNIGYINEIDEIIVCVPNKVLVKICSDLQIQENQIDAISQ